MHTGMESIVPYRKKRNTGIYTVLRYSSTVFAIFCEAVLLCFKWYSPVEQRPHAVIPELDDPVVQRRQDPWSDRVEREPLNPVALGLELRQHRAKVKLTRWRICI